MQFKQVNTIDGGSVLVRVKWNNLNHRKANHNHHIVEVTDTLNPGDNPIYKDYFDGTQSAAIEYFKKSEKLKKYRISRYLIIMQTNSIVLFEKIT